MGSVRGSRSTSDGQGRSKPDLHPLGQDNIEFTPAQNNTQAAGTYGDPTKQFQPAYALNEVTGIPGRTFTGAEQFQALGYGIAAFLLWLSQLFSKIVDPFDPDAPKSEKVGKPKGDMPGNNQKQNKQIDDISTLVKLTKVKRKLLHDAVSGKGLGYNAILRIAKEMFGKK